MLNHSHEGGGAGGGQKLSFIILTLRWPVSVNYSHSKYRVNVTGNFELFFSFDDANVVIDVVHQPRLKPNVQGPLLVSLTDFVL